MSIARGRDGIDICCLCFWPSYSCFDCETGLKKTPLLTLPQAQLMVAAVLEEGRITKKRVLEIVRYYTLRNYVAYKVRRKARMRELAKKGVRLRC